MEVILHNYIEPVSPRMYPTNSMGGPRRRSDVLTKREHQVHVDVHLPWGVYMLENLFCSPRQTKHRSENFAMVPSFQKVTFWVSGKAKSEFTPVGGTRPQAARSTPEGGTRPKAVSLRP